LSVICDRVLWHLVTFPVCAESAILILGVCVCQVSPLLITTYAVLKLWKSVATWWSCCSSLPRLTHPLSLLGKDFPLTYRQQLSATWIW